MLALCKLFENEVLVYPFGLALLMSQYSDGEIQHVPKQPSRRDQARETLMVDLRNTSNKFYCAIFRTIRF
jgi:hypothetical protein